MKPREALLVSITVLGAFFVVRGLAAAGPVVFLAGEAPARVIAANLVGVLVQVVAGFVMILIGVTSQRSDALASGARPSPGTLAAVAGSILGLYFVVDGIAGLVAIAARPDAEVARFFTVRDEAPFYVVELVFGVALAIGGGVWGLRPKRARSAPLFAAEGSGPSEAVERSDPPAPPEA